MGVNLKEEMNQKKGQFQEACKGDQTFT